MVLPSNFRKVSGYCIFAKVISTFARSASLNFPCLNTGFRSSLLDSYQEGRYITARRGFDPFLAKQSHLLLSIQPNLVLQLSISSTIGSSECEDEEWRGWRGDVRGGGRLILGTVVHSMEPPKTTAAFIHPASLSHWWNGYGLAAFTRGTVSE